MAGELYRIKTGLPMVHVAYRGGGPATVDVLSGQIPLLWVPLPAIAQYIKTGKVKALAVSTRPGSLEIPNVPTVAESRFRASTSTPGTRYSSPRATPPAVIKKLEQALMA